MAKNLIYGTPVMPWTNATGANVVSGQLVAIGNVVGIALVDIAIGATGSVDLVPGRVYEGVPKVPAAVFIRGEKLLWDASAGQFDDSLAVAAAGDIMGAAIAWEPGINAQTTCTIMLTPGNTVRT